ncbi:MAG: LacI family transcriptional regulator [Firmicutes bacterium]|nr:LacI family transcriptional regulator [Bacillota bacterium]
MRPTIVDVAKRAGVCTVTASRVLNNHPNVREESRRKVLKAAEELGYIPHSAARSLRSGKTTAIGVVLPTLDDPFMAGVLAGVEEEAWQHGYFTIISQTRGAAYANEAEYVRFLTRGRVDGLILVTPRHEEEYILELERQRVPFVLADKNSSRPGVLSVTVDNFHGAYLATKHLLEMGHRAIGHLVGRPEIESSLQRLRGYQRALEEYGVEYRADLVKNGWFSREVARESVLAWLEGGNLPTAILACDDNVAFEVIAILTRHGLRVPDDVAVAGFDDDKMDTVFSPTLTSVNQRSMEVGREAVRLLLKAISREIGEERSIVIKPELMVRESTTRNRRGRSPYGQGPGLADP